MRARVICMASVKGGSGKTVLTATFGAMLAALEKKVLLIDTDAATNGLTLLYLKEVMAERNKAIHGNVSPNGIYELSQTESMPSIISLDTGADLLPATYSFMNTESVPLEFYKSSLETTLRANFDSYDYIFLDAQAGSDQYAQIAMRREISHEVVIISEYDPMSAAGIERMKALFRDDLTYDRTWVLLNKMLPEFIKSFSDFMEIAKYLSPIPWDADIVKAYARRRLALDVVNGNEFTLAIIQTLRTLLAEGIEIELEKWLEAKTTAIREPIAQQYEDANAQLEALIKEEWRIRSRESRRKTLETMAVVLAVMITLTIALTFSGDRLSIPIVMATTMGVISIIAVASTFLAGRSNEAGLKVQESRIRRQEKMLEEKLTKLEALKDASLETLVTEHARHAKVKDKLRGPDGSLVT